MSFLPSSCVHPARGDGIISTQRQNTRTKKSTADGLRIGVSLSSGIRKLKHLGALLELDRIVSPKQLGSLSAKPVCVLVWGRKTNTEAALKYAQRQQLPVWYLEDGWIRNCDTDSHSRKSYSILLDKTGVYYDSSRPSDLENLLNLPDSEFNDYCTAARLKAAGNYRRQIVAHEITKYNYCATASSKDIQTDAVKPLVLVIDQTRNDASVRFGGLQETDFYRMLDTAIEENPDARIVVRTHPDVLSGSRSGYLADYAARRHVEVHAKADNPIQWLKQAKSVYVGTSQIGYEALLCNCEVVVFGQPFYAGWGLTDDRCGLPRRCRTRSIDQLFYICHIWLARYVDPVSGAPWDLSQCLEHVILQKKQFSRNALNFCCVDITPWKRRYLLSYLRSPDGDVRFSTIKNLRSHETLLTWSYREQKRAQLIDERESVYRVEDGFIRSCGLGSDYVAPASLIIDSQALYFDRHRRSDLEDLLNFHACSEADCARAFQLRQLIVSSRVSKYNIDGKPGGTVEGWRHGAGAGKSVLVVGQVEEDESIARGCAGLNSNTALIRAVRKNCPADRLFYKPHPDVESGNRKGAVTVGVLDECVDAVLVEEPIDLCIENCDELHTMTSLAGFEALLRNKKVVTYGLPFYAGWGLTQDRMSCERRNRCRSLDELVFLTLIEYPRYLHLSTGEFISAETQVRLIRDQAKHVQQLPFKWIRKIKNISQALLYAA